MTTSDLRLQLDTTAALLKFIRDHKGHADRDLCLCFDELQKGKCEQAVKHALSVKPHGMGGITDWFPTPITNVETSDYNEQVLRALTNKWCRVIALLFQEREVSRSSQKGELEASVRKDGYVLCPFCRKTFSSLSSSWDGTKHTTCGVRLKLIPGE